MIMHVSADGRAYIEGKEAFRPHAYPDIKGVWTIAFGHTSAAGAPLVTPGLTVTRAQADEILSRDLLKYETEVLREVYVPLTQHMFDALVSFTYNCGEGSLRQLVVASGINSGHYVNVPLHMRLYNKADGKVIAGLVKRRAEEAAMFSKAA